MRKEKEVNGRGKERRKGKEGVWKAHVVRCSRRGRLAFLERRRTQSSLAHEVTLDPSHAPPCSRCKPSLLAVHTQTHTTRQFFTRYKHWGETLYENADPFHIFAPLLLFLHAILLFRVKDPSLVVEVGECCNNIGPLFFFPFSSSEIFSRQENGWLSLIGGKKMIWHGAIITGVLIRGMSCIITTVFDNTTANHLRPLAKVSRCY